MPAEALPRELGATFVSLRGQMAHGLISAEHLGSFSQESTIPLSGWIEVSGLRASEDPPCLSMSIGARRILNLPPYFQDGRAGTVHRWVDAGRADR